MVETSYTTEAGYGTFGWLKRIGEFMSNIFNFGDGISEEELSLEKPDDSEELDHKRHVTRCAQRYLILRRGQQAQDKRLLRIELILFGFFLLAMASKIGILGAAKAIFGF